ncbi:unnamed protein product [Tetraodon nigroviridis]|uniref:(spotted green pufferfish) hypothetical protein n=1 Tax=Tetraodon nigroviridis TaxID=99883 RepID=Q4SXT5_TETNG|nr:unnamed protein product [Tetraodon nigroviridis]
MLPDCGARSRPARLALLPARAGTSVTPEQPSYAPSSNLVYRINLHQAGEDLLVTETCGTQASDGEHEEGAAAGTAPVNLVTKENDVLSGAKVLKQNPACTPKVKEPWSPPTARPEKSKWIGTRARLSLPVYRARLGGWGGGRRRGVQLWKSSGIWKQRGWRSVRSEARLPKFGFSTRRLALAPRIHRGRPHRRARPQSNRVVGWGSLQSEPERVWF